METKNKISLTIILTSIVWVIISLVYLFAVIDKYEGNVCKDVNWSNIRGYDGTTYGGYSCYKKADRIEIYFNPMGENNCIGCSKEEYHFICYTGKDNFCFLSEKYLKQEVPNSSQA